MSTSTYKYVMALLTVALLGTSYVLLNNQMYVSVGQVQTGTIGYTGMVCKQIIRADGAVEPQFCDHNVLKLDGKNFTTSQLFAAPVAAGAVIANISLGNGTVISQTSTVANFGGIADCNLGPSNTLTWINVNNGTGTYLDASGNVSANYKWTANCGSGTGERVNQTAISVTTGAFFAVNAFTDVYLQANDQLNVTWYVWIT